MVDQFLNVGHLVPVSGGGFNNDDVTPTYRPGAVSFYTDGFGFHVCMYVKNASGSVMAQGDLGRRVAELAVSNITSGTTTSATKVGAFTADKHVGMLLYVDDTNAVAGDEPEGEVGVIVSNTADVVNINPQRPFTAALAVNDDIRIFSVYHTEDSADGDLSYNVFGVVMADEGISNNQFGWVMQQGLCPAVLHSAADVAAGARVVADAKAVGDAATDAVELWVGVQVGTFTASSHDTLKTPVVMTLFGAIGGLT